MKPICFVIMGFGKKTDPSTGKTYDLDKTYTGIIKPAVLEAGYECIRADEIKDSSVIDKSMYVLLVRAELVIADITTYNTNAIYELGIRHAVRPYSTIILKEIDGNIPFDLNHNRMFLYHHLGDDIGIEEGKRCKKELIDLINTITKTKNIDSPLYEYINNLKAPELPEEEYRLILDELAEQERFVFAITEKAKEAMAQSDFIVASKYWKKANKQVTNEPYFIQQWALCAYKSKYPSELSALTDALKIIEELDPNGETKDPETLGITGAIYKRLWNLNKDMEYLDRAIEYYGKCYNYRKDYYTGENYALCLNLKARHIEDKEEQLFSKIFAKKVRKSIVYDLENLLKNENVDSRVDAKWIYATLSHCYYAIGDTENYEKNKSKFYSLNLVEWERKTFEDGKEMLNTVITETER